MYYKYLSTVYRNYRHFKSCLFFIASGNVKMLFMKTRYRKPYENIIIYYYYYTMIIQYELHCFVYMFYFCFYVELLYGCVNNICVTIILNFILLLINIETILRPARYVMFIKTERVGPERCQCFVGTQSVNCNNIIGSFAFGRD